MWVSKANTRIFVVLKLLGTWTVVVDTPTFTGDTAVHTHTHT